MLRAHVDLDIWRAYQKLLSFAFTLCTTKNVTMRDLLSGSLQMILEERAHKEGGEDSFPPTDHLDLFDGVDAMREGPAAAPEATRRGRMEDIQEPSCVANRGHLEAR